MNRLWVRISLSFAGIMAFLIIIPISVSILTYSLEGFDFEEPAFLEEQVDNTSHFKEYATMRYQMKRSFRSDFDF